MKWLGGSLHDSHAPHPRTHGILSALPDTIAGDAFLNESQGLSVLPYAEPRSNVTSKVSDLTENMLSLDPALRPTAGCVLQCLSEIISSRTIGPEAHPPPMKQDVHGEPPRAAPRMLTDQEPEPDSSVAEKPSRKEQRQRFWGPICQKIRCQQESRQGIQAPTRAGGANGTSRSRTQVKALRDEATMDSTNHQAHDLHDRWRNNGRQGRDHAIGRHGRALTPSPTGTTTLVPRRPRPVPYTNSTSDPSYFWCGSGVDNVVEVNVSTQDNEKHERKLDCPIYKHHSMHGTTSPCRGYSTQVMSQVRSHLYPQRTEIPAPHNHFTGRSAAYARIQKVHDTGSLGHSRGMSDDAPQMIAFALRKLHPDLDPRLSVLQQASECLAKGLRYIRTRHSRDGDITPKNIPAHKGSFLGSWMLIFDCLDDRPPAQQQHRTLHAVAHGRIAKTRAMRYRGKPLVRKSCKKTFSTSRMGSCNVVHDSGDQESTDAESIAPLVG